MRFLTPSLSSNEFDRILNNRSMDRSILITDYIEQLEKEDEIQKGKTNNDIRFNQRCKRKSSNNWFPNDRIVNIYF